MGARRKICVVSAVPMTLWFCYRHLFKFLIRDYHLAVISSEEEKLSRLGAELPCEIYPVPITRRISPFQDVLAILKSWRFMKKGRYEIVHAHTPKGGLVGMLAAFLAKCPIRIYTIHGLPMETAKGVKRKILWTAEWLSCALATHILAVSPSLREKAIECGFSVAAKIKVFESGSACGIDLNYFSPTDATKLAGERLRQDAGIPDTALVIGYIGRIVPDKGIETLTRAFNKVLAVRGDCFLLLVGPMDDSRETFCDKLAAELQTNPKIVFNNRLVENVVPYYAAMDILTLPSLREGFGLTLIEAAAMGLPTVASNITGCKDAVIDGVTGTLVPANDAEALFSALVELLDNPELRKKYGQAGKKMTNELFSEDRLIHEHLALYKTLFDVENEAVCKSIAKRPQN